ncbi:MAG: phosphatase PAP2 family protein [Myxococcales bacterium]
MGVKRPPAFAPAAVDRLLLAFLLALAAVTAACVPSPGLLLAAIGAMAASILALARWRGRSPLLRISHAFVAVPVLAALVNAVGPVIENLNPRRYDRALAAIDARFFGPLAAAWTGALGRPDWLTDAAALAYARSYVLPIICAALLWKQGRLGEFERLVFSLSAVLLVSYAAYFIAPAAGPRVPPAQAQQQLGGGAASAALRLFLRTCERNELDAFPSGHTATSLVFLFEAWPMFRRRRFFLAAAVAAIVFSTVYLSLHYVVDVVAGAALAGLVLIVLRRLAASRMRTDRWATASAS